MPSSDPRPGWRLFLLAAAVFAADQATKYAVEKLASPRSNYELIPCCLNLVRTDNPGVAFGMLAESQSPMRAPMLIFFSLAVIALIVWLMVTSRAGGWFGQYGTTLILGGAIGNLADRVTRHSVVDFVDFHVGNYHWYTFNLADSAIVIGAGLVILELLRDLRHPTHERA